LCQQYLCNGLINTIKQALIKHKITIKVNDRFRTVKNLQNPDFAL
jgi:hypothetical protein